MKELKNIIGKNIARLRIKNKLTQLELAERLNYSDKSVSKWERCESVPDIYVLVKLSELFSVSVDHLITDHDSEKKSKEPVVDSTECHDSAKAEKRRRVDVRVLTAVVIASILLLSLGVFVAAWICKVFIPSVFVYAVTVCIVVVLVFNSVWRRGKNNSVILCILIASLLGSVYVAFRQYDPWQVFLLALPSFLVVYLASKLKK